MSRTEPRHDSYSRAQKALHWAIVTLLALQYLAFDGIAQAFGRGLDAGVLPYTPSVVGHIAAGSLILVLMAARLALRMRRGVPAAPKHEPRLAKLAATAVHRAFYGLLIALPLAGLAAWFLPSERLGGLHDLGQTLLLWLIGVHVAAVLVHQFWWRSGIIARMT